MRCYILVFLLAVISSASWGRSYPNDWDNFVQSVDIILEARVLESRLVKDTSFADVEFEVVELTLEPMDTLFNKADTLIKDKVRLTTFWGINTAPVGTKGLFFLRQGDKDSLKLADPDVGYWQEERVYLNDKAHDQTCSKENFEIASVYTFPTIYLPDVPPDFWFKGYLLSESCIFVPETLNISYFQKRAVFEVDQVKPLLKEVFNQ